MALNAESFPAAFNSMIESFIRMADSSKSRKVFINPNNDNVAGEPVIVGLPASFTFAVNSISSFCNDTT